MNVLAARRISASAVCAHRGGAVAEACYASGQAADHRFAAAGEEANTAEAEVFALRRIAPGAPGRRSEKRSSVSCLTRASAKICNCCGVHHGGDSNAQDDSNGCHSHSRSRMLFFGICTGHAGPEQNAW